MMLRRRTGCPDHPIRPLQLPPPVLEDLAHGEATGQDAYVSMSLAALGWLFPA
jgi:hypothetical protein